MSSPHVFDVTTENFQEVVQQSAKVPVVLDFWAEWCGPCKTFAPLLESLAEEYGGAFLVGKVDTEKEPELGAAFRVQSIPFVCLLQGGRPADAFSGAVPEKELREFLARAGIEPLASESTDEDEDSPAARLRAAVAAASRGDAAAARSALGGIHDEDDLAGDRDRLLEGLTLFDAELSAEAPSASQHLSQARSAVLDGNLELAMGHILESVQSDMAFADGLGRKAMLLCFVLVGEDSDLASDYRRRLTTLLY